MSRPQSSAGSWRLEDKIGRSLDAIHSEGHGVVGWKDKLKNSMERFFIRLKVDKPVERNNVSSSSRRKLDRYADPSSFRPPLSTRFRRALRYHGPLQTDLRTSTMLPTADQSQIRCRPRRIRLGHRMHPCKTSLRSGSAPKGRRCADSHASAPSSSLSSELGGLIFSA